MKALFIGLVQIGQRHLRNLRTLIPEINIMVYRTSKENFLDNENKICKNLDLKNFYNIEEF